MCGAYDVGREGRSKWGRLAGIQAAGCKKEGRRCSKVVGLVVELLSGAENDQVAGHQAVGT